MKFFDWLFRRKPPVLQPILIHRGQVVTCETGHEIADVVQDIRLGDRRYAESLGNWRIEPPEIGAIGPRCFCGSRYWRYPAAYHIRGRGWVPPG